MSEKFGMAKYFWELMDGPRSEENPREQWVRTHDAQHRAGYDARSASPTSADDFFREVQCLADEPFRRIQRAVRKFGWHLWVAQG